MYADVHQCNALCVPSAMYLLTIHKLVITKYTRVVQQAVLRYGYCIQYPDWVLHSTGSVLHSTGCSTHGYCRGRGTAQYPPYMGTAQFLWVLYST